MDFMIKLVESHGLVCKPLTWPHPIGLSWIVIYRPGLYGRYARIDPGTGLFEGRAEHV